MTLKSNEKEIWKKSIIILSVDRHIDIYICTDNVLNTKHGLT